MTDDEIKRVIAELYEKIDLMKKLKMPEHKIKKTADILDIFIRREEPPEDQKGGYKNGR
jgi:hypothetical protein